MGSVDVMTAVLASGIRVPYAVTGNSAGQPAFVSDDQQVLLRAIPGARLSLYSGVGHGVHLAQPERVVNDIVDFLTATASSR